MAQPNTEMHIINHVSTLSPHLKIGPLALSTNLLFLFLAVAFPLLGKHFTMAAHEHRAQSFRIESSNKITSIPTRLESGQHIILWRDIQHVFADAKTVFNNGKAVLFLTDDGVE